MPRKTPQMQLVEITGETFPDLAAAQRAALPATAHDLAATMRALLHSGKLIQRNGRIEPNA